MSLAITEYCLCELQELQFEFILKGRHKWQSLFIQPVTYKFFKLY